MLNRWRHDLKNRVSRPSKGFLESIFTVLGKVLVSPFQFILSLLGVILAGAKILVGALTVLFTFLGALVAMVTFVIVLVTKQVFNVDIQTTLPDQAVLHVKLSGKLSKTASQNSLIPFISSAPSASLFSLIQTLEKATFDPKIQGIWVELNGPKLSLSQTQELRQLIKKARAAGKPVLASAFTFGGDATGGGMLSYFLASAAEHIMVSPLGIVGITGLSVEMPFIGGLMNDLGIQPELLRHHEYKATFENFERTSFSKPHRENLDQLLTDFMGQIVKGISASRSLEEARVKHLIHEAPWLDKEALHWDLIDQIGEFEDVQNWFATRLKHQNNTQEGEQETPSQVSFVSPKVYEAYTPTSLEEDLSNSKDSWWSVSWNKAKSLTQTPSQVAVISVEGMISHESDLPHPLLRPMITTPEQVESSLKQALEDESIHSIVLRINSGGGTVFASRDLFHRIHYLLAPTSQKPIVVSVGSAAASGAYWAALPAHKIVAEPGSLVGSIGTFTGKLNLEGLWKNLNVAWPSISKGENALMWSPHRPLTGTQKNKLHQWLSQSYNNFAKTVADFRKLSPEMLDSLARGRIWSGRYAKENGLVDELGGLLKAIQIAQDLSEGPDEGRRQAANWTLYPKAATFWQKIRLFFSVSLPELISSVQAGTFNLSSLSQLDIVG
ncbi:MAG: signal peptide peptidase SppA [bacterium]|nr:signal peptide peptidase SppA [bacterium]